MAEFGVANMISMQVESHRSCNPGPHVSLEPGHLGFAPHRRIAIHGVQSNHQMLTLNPLCYTDRAVNSTKESLPESQNGGAFLYCCAQQPPFDASVDSCQHPEHVGKAPRASLVPTKLVRGTNGHVYLPK